MRSFKKNYHTHTPLCHHAKGELEEYVKAAIERGLDTLGFSCHAPYPFGDRHHSWFRMTSEEQVGYVNEILALREKYEGQIKLLVGYEAEYYPALFKKMVEGLRSLPVDYMILGQHFFNNEYDGIHCTTHVDDIRSVKGYVRQVCAAMRTGLYTYVAHPDLNNYAGDMDEYAEAMRPICEVSLETDTPLEINLLGIRGNRPYPKECFWRVCSEYGCKVVVGSDAHSPDELRVCDDFTRAMEIVDKYGLNYTDEIKLRSLK